MATILNQFNDVDKLFIPLHTRIVITRSPVDFPTDSGQTFETTIGDARINDDFNTYSGTTAVGVTLAQEEQLSLKIYGYIPKIFNVKKGKPYESPRVCRRQFDLSHAAWADSAC